MPVDHRWEQTNLATFFEYIKRVRQFNRTQDEPLEKDATFDAGEFAITDGGLSLAFLHFLQQRGYQLSTQEQHLLSRLRRHNLKRYCVVLSRLTDGNYIVCYLATHRNAFFGKNISSPIGRFFSIAIGSTPPWPPGYDSVKVRPPWLKGSFVFGIPVVQSKLEVPKHGTARRFLVQAGELQRLKSFIQKRIQLFDQNHKKLRRAHVEHMSYHDDEAQSANEDLKFADSLAERIGAEEARITLANRVEETERPTAIPRENDRDRPSYEYRGFKQPIRWLQPDKYHHNGRFLIANLKHDIMESSMYLKNARVRRPRVQFSVLPKPFYAPLLRRSYINALIRMF